MNINAHGRIESTPQLAALERHYKQEGYNSMMVCRTDQFGNQVTISHYWAVDWQVIDPTVAGPVRYKILYVGTPASFTAWMKEVLDKLAGVGFKALEMLESVEKDAVAPEKVVPEGRVQ